MAERSAKVQKKSQISSGRLNKHTADYSRKLKQLTSFDEECRKILLQNDDKHFEKQKSKQAEVTGDYELTDDLVKNQKLARKKSRKAYESCLCHLNNAGALINQQPSTSASNKFPQNHREELIELSKQRISSDSKPFSDALQVLSINKDSFNSQKIVILRPTPHKSTSFWFRDFRKKLKHRFGGTTEELSYNNSIFGDDCVCRTVDILNPSNSSTSVKTKANLGNKQDNLKSPMRKKIDFSSGRLSRKQEVDVVLEAKRYISERVLKNLNATGTSQTDKQSPKTLERILSSLEDEFFPLTPRRDNIMRYGPSNGQHKTCLSMLRTNMELTSCNDNEEYDNTIESFSTETRSSLIQSTDEEAQDTIISATHKIKANGETTIENGTFTRTYNLDMPENIKYPEEHRSPVSVLEQIFTEDANSPSSIMLQTANQRLKPRRLQFEESPVESPINEQDDISNYIHLVMQAACLSWDKLSIISPQSQELLNSSLLNELKFLPFDYSFDPKLIFDHMNEVLAKIHLTHLWLPFVKPRICFSPLEELVVDEMMREAPDFYLLSRTDETTLDHLVARDLADSRLWFDVRVETQHIIVDISEEILEESVLDVILGFGE